MNYSDSDYRYVYGTSPAENAELLIQDWGVEVALKRAVSAASDAAKDLTEEQFQSWLGRDAKYWAAIVEQIESKK